VETAEEAEEQAGLRHRHPWLGLRWDSIWRRRTDARSWRGHPVSTASAGPRCLARRCRFIHLPDRWLWRRRTSTHQ